MRVPYRKPGKYSHMPQDFLMTQAKVDKLKKELDKLKSMHPRAAAEVRRLAELGDFSENVEYQLAKGRLRGINNAILRIANQLKRAVIISPQKTDMVQVGHTVTVESEGKQKTYQILGSAETDPQKGIISYTSPLGAALIGHKVGDTVTVKLADKEVAYTILKIND